MTSSGAVYGPGVTSRPLTGSAQSHPSQATNSLPAAAASQVVPMHVQPQAVSLVPSSAAALTATPVPAHSAGTASFSAAPLLPKAPCVSYSPTRGNTQLRGAAPAQSVAPAIPVPVPSSRAAVPGVAASNHGDDKTIHGDAGDVPGIGTVISGDAAMVPVGEGITPGRLQGGMQAGLRESKADETQPSSAIADTDSDVWSDADSDDLESQAYPSDAVAGPVAEGMETNSDAWSDSLASEPDSPIAHSQAAGAAAAPQPTKRSRFGRLLSRAKGSGGPTAPEQQQALPAPAAGESAASIEPAVMSSATAAAPARSSMRSKLFGRARCQNHHTGLPQEDVDESATLQEEEVTGNDTAAHPEEQSYNTQGSMPTPDFIWHGGNGVSDNVSQAVLAQSPTSAVFVTPSPVLPNSPLSTASVLGQDAAAEEAELDPLSPLFEERARSPLPPRAHTLTDVSDPSYQQQVDPLTPAYDEFDPLTATMEEFNAYNRSIAPQAMLGMSDAQQQPQGIAEPDASKQQHKGRSMAGMLKLRKAAAPSSSPASAATDALTSEPTPVGTDTNQLPTQELQSDVVAGMVARTAAVPKPRSRPFSLLRKRSKGDAHATAAAQSQQQQLSTGTGLQPDAAAAQFPASSQGANGQSAEQQGWDRMERQPLAEQDLGEVLHANTQVGLSAGLPSTFGSFMAASTRSSPGATSDSPQEMPLPDLAMGQSSFDHVGLKSGICFQLV